jgi:hypothetical protein
VTDPATLEPIIYERAEGGGWRVPDDERERWDNPPRVDAPKGHTTAARPLPELVLELEGCLYLDDRLGGRLRELYEADPPRTTHLVELVLEKARAGELRSPSGFLAAKLLATPR